MSQDDSAVAGQDYQQLDGFPTGTFDTSDGSWWYLAGANGPGNNVKKLCQAPVFELHPHLIHLALWLYDCLDTGWYLLLVSTYIFHT